MHTGYSDTESRDLLTRLKPLESPRHFFELNDVRKKTRDIHQGRPDLAADIEVAEPTASGKSGQGTFKALRLDTTAERPRDEEALG